MRGDGTYEYEYAVIIKLSPDLAAPLCLACTEYLIQYDLLVSKVPR